MSAPFPHVKSRALAFSILLAVPGVLLALAPTAAAENSADAHFATTGSPGATGVQDAVLAIGYTADTPGAPTPPDVPVPDASRAGYTSAIWSPSIALVPSAILPNSLVGVLACGAAKTADGVDPTSGCVSLTRRCPDPNPGALVAQTYCPSVDATARVVTVKLGLGGAWAGSLRLLVSVAKQPLGSIPGGTVQLNNDLWIRPTPAVSTTFVTLPTLVASVHVTTHSGCGASEEIQPIPLTPDGTQTFYSVGEDVLGNCLGPIPARWDLTADIGALSGANPSTSITLQPGHVGVGRVTANDQLGHVGQSAPVVVRAGAAARAIVTDAQGREVQDITLTADDVLVLVASTADRAGNALAPAVADWLVTGGCGQVVTPSAPLAVFTADKTHTPHCRIQATVATLAPDSTGDITVLQGTTASMTIRGPTGLPRGAATYVTGVAYPLAATVEDAKGNSAPAPATTAWSVVGGCGALDANSGTVVRFSPSRDTGDCRVVASLQAAPVATGDTPSAADHAAILPDSDAHATRLAASTGAISVLRDLGAILIRTAPANGGIAYHDVTLTSDDARTLYAAGYDTDLRYRGDLPNAAWSLDNAKATITGTGEHVAFEPMKVGDVAITVTVPGATSVVGKATVHITPGAAVSLTIVDASTMMPPTLTGFPGGSSFALHAHGTDAHGNDLGPMDVAWTTNGGCGTITKAGSGATLFTGYVPRPACNVTATDGVSFASAPVSIAPPAVDHILLVDAANGAGSTVSARTLTADQGLTLVAAGFDAANHYVGDQVVDWTSTGGASISLAAPLHATSVVASANKVGSGVVTASSAAPSASTGTLTIVHGDLSIVSVENKIDGSGSPVLAQNLRVGDGMDVYAIGRDADSNLIGLVSVTWSTDCTVPVNCPGSVSPTSGVSTTFRAQRSGDALVKADDGNGHSGATGRIFIHPLPASNIRIIRSVDNSEKGAPKGTPADTTDATTADQPVTFCAIALDSAGSDAGLESVNWSVSPALAGKFSTTPNACTSYDPALAGATTITATDEGANHAPLSATHVLTVVHGALAKIILAAPATTSVAGSTIHLTVTAADADANPVLEYAGVVHLASDDATLAASDLAFTPADQGVKTVDVILKAAGARSLTASDTARGPATPITGALTVTVTPATLVSFTRDASSAQIAGTPFTLTLTARDAFNNVVTSYAGDKTLSSNCGMTPLAYTFAAGVGSASVTATNATACAVSIGGVTGPTITIQPGALAALRVRTPSGAALGPATAATGISVWVTLWDAYGNTRTGDTGTITLSGSPSPIVSGASLTIAAGVGKTATVSTLKINTQTAGETLTASYGTSAVHGTSAVFPVNVGAIASYTLDIASGDKAAGVPFATAIAPKDAGGNTVTSDTSTPTFASDDCTLGASTAPPFSNGLSTGSVTITGGPTGPFSSGGVDCTLTVSGQTTPNVIHVVPGATSTLAFDALPAVTAGAPFSMTVRALDAFGNAAKTFTGSAALASNCDLRTPATISFAAGVSTSSVNLTKAGTACTLTATPTGFAASTTPAFAVAPGTMDHYDLTLATPTPSAGTSFVLTLADRDAWQNVPTGGAATRALVFDAPAAPDGTKPTAVDANGQSVPFGAPTAVAFANGVGTVTITLPDAGDQRLTVTDSTPQAGSNGKSDHKDVHVATGAPTALVLLWADPSKAACAAKTIDRACIVSSKSVDGDAHPFQATRTVYYTFYFGLADAFDNLVSAGKGRFHDVGTGTGSPVPHDTGSDTAVAGATWKWNTATPAGSGPAGGDRATLEDMDGVYLPVNLLVQVS